jgi:hypothetical protein
MGMLNNNLVSKKRKAPPTPPDLFASQNGMQRHLHEIDDDPISQCSESDRFDGIALSVGDMASRAHVSMASSAVSGSAVSASSSSSSSSNTWQAHGDYNHPLQSKCLQLIDWKVVSLLSFAVT